MVRKIKGVTEPLDNGKTMVWTAPTRWYLYEGDSLVDAWNRREPSMTVEEAHAYSDAHRTHQQISAV